MQKCTQAVPIRPVLFFLLFIVHMHGASQPVHSGLALFPDWLSFSCMACLSLVLGTRRVERGARASDATLMCPALDFGLRVEGTTDPRCDGRARAFI